MNLQLIKNIIRLSYRSYLTGLSFNYEMKLAALQLLKNPSWEALAAYLDTYVSKLEVLSDTLIQDQIQVLRPGDFSAAQISTIMAASRNALRNGLPCVIALRLSSFAKEEAASKKVVASAVAAAQRYVDSLGPESLKEYLG